MTDMVVQKNIAALVSVRLGSVSNAQTAGAATDNTTKTGVAIDRKKIHTPMSAVASVLADGVLASGATLKVAFTVQDSANNSDWADYQSTAAATLMTGPSGGGAVSGQLSLAVDLSSARDYVRLTYVPDLSSAGTDTAITRATWTLAGEDRLAAVA